MKLLIHAGIKVNPVSKRCHSYPIRPNPYNQKPSISIISIVQYSETHINKTIKSYHNLINIYGINSSPELSPSSKVIKFHCINNWYTGYMVQLFLYTVWCGYKTTNIPFQILITEIQKLWNIFCKFKVWSMFFVSYCYLLLCHCYIQYWVMFDFVGASLYDTKDRFQQWSSTFGLSEIIGLI